jgi:hypothetical protein
MSPVIIKARENKRQMKLMQDSGRKKQGTKKSALHYSVTIDAKFGSDMQRTVAVRLLDQFLAVWKEAAESRHKKNSIRIIQGNESGSLPANDCRPGNGLYSS